MTNVPRDEYIWIDAVCIDQGNVEERSRQVTMMYNLYRRSTGVMACIGPADDDSAWFASIACGFNEVLSKMDTTYLIGDERVERAMAMLATAIDERQSGRLSKAMAKFQAREYWARLWIIQEFSASRDFSTDILCGDTYIPCVALVLLYKCFNAERPLTRFQAQSSWDHHMGAVFNAVAADNSTFFGPYTLLGVINEFSQFRCADPRDRLFGMLWLVNFMFHPHGAFEPDYTWSRWKLVAQALARSMTCSLLNPLVLFEAFSVKPSDRHDAAIEREQDLLTTKGRSELACSAERRSWTVSQKSRILTLEHFILQSQFPASRGVSHSDEEGMVDIGKDICDIIGTKTSADGDKHDLILYASPEVCQKATLRDSVIPIELYQYAPKSGRFVPFLVVSEEKVTKYGMHGLLGIVLGHPSIAACYDTILDASSQHLHTSNDSDDSQAEVILSVDRAMELIAKISELDEATTNEFREMAFTLLGSISPCEMSVRLRGHTFT